MFPRISRFARKRKKVEVKAQTPVVENKAAPLQAEAEEPEVKHLGGPYFEVGGERVRGKDAVAAKLREIEDA